MFYQNTRLMSLQKYSASLAQRHTENGNFQRGGCKVGWPEHDVVSYSIGGVHNIEIGRDIFVFGSAYTLKEVTSMSTGTAD